MSERSAGPSDVDALRLRVAQLEETLRAIQAGEVDVVIGDESAFYARETADRPYRIMVEEMQDGAVIVDADGRTILYCNRAFSDMVGQAQSELFGRGFDVLLDAASRPKWRELLQGATRRRADMEMGRNDGSTFPVSVSASMLTGESLTWVATVIDLTDRKDVERLREIQTELQLVNERKDQFIAMLGHELRNPLAPIRHATELLAQGKNDPRLVERIREILDRQVEQMTRLIDDLLDAGRITRGTLAVRRQPMDFREAAQAAVEAVGRLLERRKHKLSVQLPDAPVPLRGDSVRLTQIVSNLLANAAKYTDSGGHITLQMRTDDGVVTLSVEDDGIGIAPDLLPHIFHPFVQADTTLDRAAGGLGVGLALVRRIAELHDGSVAAYSDGPDRGARFEVTLPMTRARIADATPDSPADLGPSGLHIHVIDDNEDAGEMLALILQRRGHDVSVFADGPTALQAASERRPDLMFVDIGMPGMTGYEIAEQIRKDYGPGLKLVAVTGYGGRSDRQRALEVGFDEHAVKPVNPDRLDQLLDRFGRRERN